jgi:hypothetical protein
MPFGHDELCGSSRLAVEQSVCPDQEAKRGKGYVPREFSEIVTEGIVKPDLWGGLAFPAIGLLPLSANLWNHHFSWAHT